MQFRDRYQHPPKTGRFQANHIQRLLDSHVIGIRMVEDLEYDPVKRYGTSAKRAANVTVTETVIALPNGTTTIPPVEELERTGNAHEQKQFTPIRDPLPPAKKVRNYAVIAPYGQFGNKLFLHGKDLLTKEQAVSVFQNHAPIETLKFSGKAMEKVGKIIRPESFESRMGGYLVRNKPDMMTMMVMTLDHLKTEYPALQSELPELPAKEADIISWINSITTLVEKNGYNFHEEILKAQKNTSTPAKEKLLAKIKDEVPKEVATYLAHEGNINATYGNNLRAYVNAHHYDWEILNNFKAGIAHTAKGAPLEEVLETGIKHRIEATLQEAVTQIGNPYSEHFEKAERGMAQSIVDSLQPQTVDVLLRDKTPLVFFDGITLIPAEHIIGIPLDVQGKYQPRLPESPYFSDFVMVASDRLSHDGMSISLRHECEHMVDFKKATFFCQKYKNDLPKMIAYDVAKLEKKEALIKNISEASDPDHRTEFLKLAKARGAKVAPAKMEEAKAQLLLDILHIKVRIGEFVPKYASLALSEGKYYQQEFSKEFEIPAIMEELKGKYGRGFIERLLPQLSTVTEAHREEVHAPNSGRGA